MKCHDCKKLIIGRKHILSRPDKQHGAIPRHKAVVVCGECAHKTALRYILEAELRSCGVIEAEADSTKEKSK